MDLHHRLIDMIKSLARPDAIVAAFDALYERVVYPPVERYRLVMACYASHYNHADLLESLLPTLSRGDWSPLVSALDAHHTSLVPLLLDAGMQPDEECHGLFSNDKLVAGVKLSAMYITLSHDDVDTMWKLLNAYTSTRQPVVNIAIKFNAINCLRSLLNNETPLESPWPSAASSSLDIIRELIHRGFRDGGQCLERSGQSSFHVALTGYIHARDTSKANFIPPDTLQRLQLLVTNGSKAYVSDSCNQMPLELLLSQSLAQIQTRHDIPPPYPREQHSQLIIQTCQFLLANMIAEAGKEIVVSEITILRLQQYFQSVVVKQVPKEFTFTVHSAVELLIKMSSLLLRHSAPPNGHFYGAMLEEIVKSKPKPSILCYVYTFIHLHISHGSPPLYEHRACLLKLLLCDQSMRSLERFRNILSCMPRYEYKSFQSYVLTEMSNVGGELASLECFSLKQLCRASILETIPERRIAFHIDGIPLPVSLRSYLVLNSAET